MRKLKKESEDKIRNLESSLKMSEDKNRALDEENKRLKQ